jgi:serine/threonine-protein kinase
MKGRYLLTAMLGRGGMGEVFAAKDMQGQQEVAIKVVRRTNQDEVLAARLEREALAAGRIKSAFVPQIYEIARTDDGEIFLVMQLLHGQTLGERLRARGGAMPWEEMRPIVDDLLQGLIDAHAAGVVHRDLKPGNIFLERFDSPTRVESPLVHERAMILDFGVAKVDLEDSERLTTTGEAVGTIAYMAPEQIRGASKVDGRADLYAVAMVVFEALSGELAHDGYGQMQIVASKLERAARRLSTAACVAVPEGLESLVGKCLSRRPEGRFASAEEMLRAWRALGPPTVKPRARPKGEENTHAHPTETNLSASNVVTRSVGSRLGLALATIGFLIASVVIVTALKRKPQTAVAPPPPPPQPTIVVSTTAPATITTTTIPVVEIADDAVDASPQKPKSPVRRIPATKPTTTTTLPPITTKPRY